MKFTELALADWRQFQNVSVKFHPRLTIITGSNGAGKSTLLRIISEHYGWSVPLLATPRYSASGVMSFINGVFGWLTKPEASPKTEVGSVSYSDGTRAIMSVPNAQSISYNIKFDVRPQISGLHIPSHRPAPNYQQVQSIPTDAVEAGKAFENYRNETFNRFTGNYTQFGPTYRMKEALISMAMFGPGNQYVQRNDNVAKLFDGFRAVLRAILPPSIGFKDVSVRIPDVVIVTETGDFLIDAASGGLMALIDLAWQIFLYSHDKSEFVVSIDEPENHLHPSMQRALLGRLIDAFPSAQFIVATHSPFMVSSVKDSSVYVLRHGLAKDGREPGINSRVNSIELDTANKAGTANEILRDVLGVSVTLPEWAEHDLKQIVSGFHINDFGTDQIALLRARLDDAGLGEFYPDALRQIVSAK